MSGFEKRLCELDKSALAEELGEQGYAVIPRLLAPRECERTIDLYERPERFRSKIVMARHSYGQGEYQYFNYPLPELVAELRRTFYSLLAPVARDWGSKLRLATAYPQDPDAFLAMCHSEGQARPTPLILKYGSGDFNRLHQDLYGEIAFPLQLAILLSKPVEDFHGGEFVLTEQRPRVQTRVEVVPLAQGDGIVFANRYRPIESARGHARLNMRHGVSRVLSGERYCLGIIFHDAA